MGFKNVTIQITNLIYGKWTYIRKHQNIFFSVQLKRESKGLIAWSLHNDLAREPIPCVNKVKSELVWHAAVLNLNVKQEQPHRIDVHFTQYLVYW